MPDEKRDLHVIKVADFSDPKPFKTTQGAFHSYTFIPFIGWLPPVELNLLIAVAGISLAVALPRPGLLQKAVAFFLVPVGLAAVIGVFWGLFWVWALVERAWFLRWGLARQAARLKDPDKEVRFNAALELGWRGADAAGAVDALAAAADDPEDRVRSQALEALGKVGPGAAGAVAVLVRHLTVKHLDYVAARALGEIGPAARAAAPALVAALKGSGDLGRSMAAEALGKVGADDDATVAALVAALSDSYYITRMHAAEVLGGLKAARAVPELAKLLADKDCWRTAQRALKAVGTPEAEAALKASGRPAE